MEGVQTLILVCDIVVMYLWGRGGGGEERILKLKDVSVMESVECKNAHSFYEPFYLYCLFFLVNIGTLNM